MILKNDNPSIPDGLPESIGEVTLAESDLEGLWKIKAAHGRKSSLPQ